MRSAYRLRGCGTTAPSPLRQYARAYAYPGLRAFASLSMARSDGQANVIVYTGDNGFLNTLGAVWIRLISWLSYAY